VDLTCPRCLTENDAAAEHCRRCYGSLASARQQVARQPAVALATTAAPVVEAAVSVGMYSAATPFAAPTMGAAEPSTGTVADAGPPSADGGAATATDTNGHERATAGGNGWGVRESPRAAALRCSGGPSLSAAGAQSPPGAPSEAPLGMPPVWTGSAYAPGRRRRGGVLGIASGFGVLLGTRTGMRLAVLALLGAVGIGVFGHHYLNGSGGTHTISLPAHVAGVARVTGYGAVEAAMTTYNQQVQAQKDVKKVLSAVYGTVNADQTGLIGAYELHLILVSNQSITTDDVLNALARDNPDVSVDRQGSVTKSINGTDFQCTPINDPRAPGATDVACLWQDNDVVGVLWAYSAANADIVANTASEVQRAAEKRVS
jgi:hypothetical protein